MSDTISEILDQVIALTPQIVAATITVLIFLTIGHLIGEGLSKLLRRGQNQYSRLLNRGIRFGFGMVGLVLGLQILGLTAIATSLLATGGLMAVVLGFAFREIGENLLAGIFLGVSRSFEVGDLIESSGHIGKVRDIDLRQVWIRSADGRDIFIPSAQIFRNVLVNYTRDGLRRAEFVVGLDYGDDLGKACRILLDVIRTVDGVLADPESFVRVNQLTAQYAELQVAVWVNTDDGPGLAVVRSRVMDRCVKELRNAGFTLSSDVATTVDVRSSNRTID